MLLAVAMSPTFTWYFLAITPRVSPGFTTWVIEEDAGACATGAGADEGAPDAEEVAGADVLPGMVNFWPSFNVVSVLILVAAASCYTVTLFFFAIDQRLSPLATV
jgi:hypothetical protein